MTPRDLKIALAALALIALTAIGVVYGKPRLGKPGLVLENKALTNEVGQVVRNERVFFPANIDEFIGSDAPISTNEISTLPDDTTYGRKIYRDRGGYPIQLSAVMMGTDRSSIHRPQTCVTGVGWLIDKTEIISIPIAKPQPYTLQATALLLSKQFRDDNGVTHDMRGWYIFWFVAEDDVVPRMGEAHWLIAQNLLFSAKLPRFAYVSAYAYCRPGEEGALLARVKRIISSSIPEFQTTIGDPQQTASIEPSPRLN